jgi:hypothetical protein
MTPFDLRKPESCPACGGKEIKQVMYGFPTKETMERAKRGEVVLGGCCVIDDMPDWQCSGFHHRWFDPTDPARIELDRLMDKIKQEADERRRDSDSPRC